MRADDKCITKKQKTMFSTPPIYTDPIFKDIALNHGVNAAMVYMVIQHEAEFNIEHYEVWECLISVKSMQEFIPFLTIDEVTESLNKLISANLVSYTKDENYEDWFILVPLHPMDTCFLLTNQ